MGYSQIFFVNILIIVAAHGCVEKIIREERTRIVPLNTKAGQTEMINETYSVTTEICCEGYSKNKESEKCDPVCESCDNGVCENPDICVCNDGYEYSEDTKRCEPTCDNCKNGICKAPNVCTCNEGYQMSNETNICLPVCENCLNGSCIAPGVCRCLVGYQLNEKTKLCEINKGCKTLKEDGSCGCYEGYIYDADRKRCEPFCAICENGDCTDPGVCICLPGYENRNSSTGICEPVCETPCENGSCVRPNTCECDAGFQKSSDGSQCEPKCEKGCENGSCVRPNICECDKGFQISSDSGRCEPKCEKGCENGLCVGVNECECLDGFIKAADSINCIPACTNNTCQNTSVAGCQPSKDCDCEGPNGPCISRKSYHWIFITVLILIGVVLVVAAIAIGLKMIQTKNQSGSYMIPAKRTSSRGDPLSERETGVKEYSREAFV
ncbi:unnamed protein product [Hermetia illucens]|uniref:EGF-like domain-containing protein n=1 Tax=Hermetia illucens TaxID=343691 RepID=A0A7R8YW59_HERIL|nr:unnamed protein product [Hermetia illucens]